MSKPTFLLCRPTYFEVTYEINPWMHRSDPVDPKRARAEFENLVATYRTLGCRLQFMKPVKGLPDMVFTANGGVVHGKRVLVAQFKNKERQPETPYFADVFRACGYRTVLMPKGSVLEGQGEAFFVNGQFFAGIGFRGNAAGHRALARATGERVVSLHIVDPRWYHLDTCFCPLRDGIVLYYPGAFDAASQAAIKKGTVRAIPISKREALDFLCNSVPIGNTFVTGATPTARTKNILKKFGYRVVTVPLHEFKKSGGGARCLTLNLS